MIDTCNSFLVDNDNRVKEIKKMNESYRNVYKYKITFNIYLKQT